MITSSSELTDISTKDAVLSFVHALNNEDFSEARNYVSDQMSFVGVMGSRDGAQAYFRDMENMKLKYDIKKVFVDGADVCLLYDITISGAKIFTCGWYQVEGGKIKSIRVIFDPRPLLAPQNKSESRR
jgi:limonene-1,2-epoxide hydrolase